MQCPVPEPSIAMLFSLIAHNLYTVYTEVHMSKSLYTQDYLSTVVQSKSISMLNMRLKLVLVESDSFMYPSICLHSSRISVFIFWWLTMVSDHLVGMWYLSLFSNNSVHNTSSVLFETKNRWKQLLQRLLWLLPRYWFHLQNVHSFANVSGKYLWYLQNLWTMVFFYDMKYKVLLQYWIICWNIIIKSAYDPWPKSSNDPYSVNNRCLMIHHKLLICVYIISCSCIGIF